MITDYDKRQLRQMAESIQLFENKKLSLSDVVNRLVDLLDAIESIDIDWKKQFKSEWWQLEQVNATILDKGLILLPKEYKDIVEDSISKLKKMIDTMLLCEE